MGEKRCMNCMRRLPVEAVACPKCGFVERFYRTEFYQLPPGSKLQNGRYEVGRVVGEGGFGVVYIGYDTKFEQIVAVKEFFSKLHVSRDNTQSVEMKLYKTTDESRESYRREIDHVRDEALTIRQFAGCSGIVQVEDYFEENNTIYLIMGYVEGTALNQLITEKTRGMDASECLEKFRPMIRSLHLVHLKHMLHRDISLDNIIMKEDGSLVLLDFGAARPIDPKTSSITVKFGYGPKEQYDADGSKQGPWTDVYALCVCLWNCLTGKKLDDSLKRAKKDDIWSGVNVRGLSRKQKDTIRKGLELEYTDRIQSMNELYYGLYGEWIEKPEEDSKNKSGTNGKAKTGLIRSLFERHRRADKPYDRDGERYRSEDRPYDRDRERYRSEDRPYDRDGERYRSEDRPYDRDGERYRSEDRLYDRDGERHRREDKPYDRDGERHRSEDRPYDRDRERYRSEDRLYDRDGERHRREDKLYDRDGERYRSEDRPYDRDGERHRREDKSFDRDKGPYDLEEETKFEDWETNLDETVMEAPTLILTDINDSRNRYECKVIGDVTIGRRSDRDVRIKEETVSRIQCTVFMQGGRMMVRNDSRKNITEINGRKVFEEAELIDGSILKMGRVRMRVELQ